MDSTLGMVALVLVAALLSVVVALRQRRPEEPLPPVLLGLELARMAEHMRRVEEGDLVVIVAGSPPGIPGSTNALRVHRIGDAKNQVVPAYRDVARDA